MADANAERREVNARIVYWGVEGAGKGSNLRAIHGKLRPDHRGRLEAVPTALDPSVCWWRLPIELGEIAGVRTRIQVVAVPGGAEQAPTRKQLLDRVDGVVLVVDTRRDRIEDNVAAFEELRGALGAYGRSLESLPLVVQYNHHDESDPFVLEELHRKLDVRGAAAFEAKASDGTGVLPTLTTISKRVVRQLREHESPGAAKARAAAPSPAPAAPAQRAPLEAAAPPPAPARAEPLRDAAPRATAPASRTDAPAARPPLPAREPAIVERPAPRPAPASDGRTTAIVLESAPAPRPGSFDLEAAALDAEVDLLDERDDAVSRAQDLLDPSWSEVSGDLATPIDDSAPLGPASLPGGWHVLSAERPVVIGASTLQIPIVVADSAGRELGFRLTVSLDPLLED